MLSVKEFMGVNGRRWPSHISPTQTASYGRTQVSDHAKQAVLLARPSRPCVNG
jgi:hypothetical protein